MDDRPRILLVTPASPHPPTSGGAQRTALLYAALAASADVDTFLLENPGPEDRAILAGRYRLVGCFAERGWLRRAWWRAIGMVCPELRAVMPDPRKRGAVDNVLARFRYDLVVLRYSATACQLRGLRHRRQGMRLLVDVDDALSQLVVRSGRPFVHRMVLAACSRAILARERVALTEVDGLWVAGKPPFSLAGGPPIARLPNIAFHQPAPYAQGAEASGVGMNFLGVGQFTYPPNLEGFDWFLRCIWPTIRLSIPTARLRLVGRPPPKAVVDRWSAIPGVVLTGIVDDLEEEYRAARVAIAPVLRGGGTRIKVIEALTLGIPCVCTSHAATDLDALTSLVIANDAESFARQCIDLATDDARRTAIKRAGQVKIAEHFSPGNLASGVAALLKATAAGVHTHPIPDFDSI